jgi:hypothetical protein
MERQASVLLRSLQIAGYLESSMPKRSEQVLKNGVKLVGEMFLPGTSLLLQENIRSGVAHAAVGILASVALGVPGLLLVAANSFTQSVTGKGLIANLINGSPRDPRDVNLAAKVAADVAEGLTYEEIRADIIEDIEDLYQGAIAGKTHNEKTPHETR